MLLAGIRLAKRLYMENSVLDRRAFVLGASAVAAVMPLLALSAAAQEAPRSWEDAVKRIAGDAQPTSNGKLILDLPEVADNGNMVPVTVSVDSPMTEQEHVNAVHVIATANPHPSIATFRFTLLSGRASVSSRMRLAGTQDVIALAELNDGKFIMARRPVRVTISGCGA
jgi:sulfur-oxidizing protein SoxY